MAEKILLSHSTNHNISLGEFIYANIDLVMSGEDTLPLAIRQFRRLRKQYIYDKERVVIVPDHFTPNKDVQAAELAKVTREFAYEHDIKHYYEVGRHGIGHVIIPEKGLVKPGYLVVGADSHPCTYGALSAFATGVGSTDMAVALATGRLWFQVPNSIKVHLKGKLNNGVTSKDIILFLIGKIGVDGANYKVIEFTGNALKYISIESRMTIANMTVEAGAKTGLFPVDKLTKEYFSAKGINDYIEYHSDPDAQYEGKYEINLDKLEPQISMPHSPENVVPISEMPNISVNQCLLGTCTNGRIEDLRLAASIISGKEIHSRVRFIVIPGSQDVYKKAIEEGLIRIFINSGAVVCAPTCGPCFGGHSGILASGEKAIATSNRNFRGRMGHINSEVYLASPVIVAVTALLGRIPNKNELTNFLP